MQEILSLITQKKREFAKLPLFDFMQDKSIDPRDRLSFAPCMAHFIMSFSDLNKYIFREDLAVNRLQYIINEHAHEDEGHCTWFLTDLEKLGMNPTSDFNQALKFIWGEETKITRQLAYQITGYTFQADPIVKMAVIEALEEMGNTFFSISSQVSLELENYTGNKYTYFGVSHLELETGHAVGTPGAENFIANLQLTDSQRQEAIYAVEQIFQIFFEWTYELLAFAQKQNSMAEVDQKLPEKVKVCT
ncbi:MAG: hypothetical protein AAF378_18495 [Cyanobacteria bacterium P01_A01_bin.84]